MSSKNSSRIPPDRTFGVKAKNKRRVWIFAGALVMVVVLTIGGVVLSSRNGSPNAPSINYIKGLTLKDWVKYYPGQVVKGEFVTCIYNPAKWTPGYTFSCNIYNPHHVVLAPTKDVANGGNASEGWNLSIIFLSNNG